MLQIRDLSLRLAGRTLLEGANLTLEAGWHVGLVGQNGTGKTTLLRAIRGELALESGSISLNPRARLGMTSQEAPGGKTSLIDTVLGFDTRRAELLTQAEVEQDASKLAAIHAELEDRQAYAAPARAATLLAGLGFDEAAQARPCSAYSGGMRMRVALAGLLFTEPDLLLLDEPTNHLDLEATLWLEGWLRAYPGTLLLVSHDRNLLNRSVGRIAHLSGKRIQLYTGGYDAFETRRRQAMRLAEASQAKQEAQAAHIRAFVERFRYKASKARQAQSRLKMLERMQPIAALAQDTNLPISFPEPTDLASPLYTLSEGEAGYDATPVLKRLNFRLDAEDRIALLGANGQGKSTLVKVLAQRLALMQGKVEKSSKLKVGYFAQHQLDELPQDGTPLSALQALMPRADETLVRKRLGGFGFGEEKADTSILKLSGGEKARLTLALMAREAPHLLLLDEPTNHLDVDSRQALVQAINAFPGAVVLVSHDTHLIEACADQLWLVDGGRVQPFEGDLEDYRRWHLSRRNETKRQTKPDKSQANARKTARREAADARADQVPLKKESLDIEASLEKLAELIAKLDAALASPELYQEGGQGRLSALQIKRAALLKEQEVKETRWLEIQEAL